MRELFGKSDIASADNRHLEFGHELGHRRSRLLHGRSIRGDVEGGWLDVLHLGIWGGIAGAQGQKLLRKKWTRGAIFHAMLCIDAVVLCFFFFAGTWWQLAILLACRICTTVIVNIIYLAIRQESG
ncbi:hypothetical protein DQX05_26815 [Paenibacillus thiaminolyticus]|uniref:Uncharacterized protein n=2 Tax=Paenibacillus thiaminolyticus TaxID=49283 RepID=A0A3A3GEY8_PANTH|nr:hypothetical protein DQX05_26815 [Paenibacillus thiaminolyticus]